MQTAGWKRRPAREGGAMLGGGARRGGGGAREGEVDGRGEREGKEEVKKTGTQMFAAGSEENRSKRTDRHKHARTATPRLVGESPEPCW